MLWMFQRVNYGELTNEKNAALPDLRSREWLVIVPIVAIAIAMGIVPNLFLHPMEASIDRTLALMQRNVTVRVQASHQPSAISHQP
jgi:NADH-quinone oxidoreductase subunit M